MRETRELVSRWGLSATTAVVVAVLAAGALHAGVQAPARGGGGPKEGITVHGHWTIDIRQPNGALVTHREFENALTDTGAMVIADVLSGRTIPGTWSIELDPPLSDPANGACLIPSSPVPCVIAEPNMGFPDRANVFQNLIRSATALGLSGTATAGRASSIGRVVANIFTCPSRVAFSACNATTYTLGGNFSIADFSLIPVVPGQLIQASVTYTFSAASTVVR